MTSTTIVIPAYNLWAKTNKCLDSLTKTARGAQVVVVDNGSADGTADFVRRRMAKEKAFELRLVALPQNLNFAGGCNEGLTLAVAQGTDVVVFLNNDTIAERGWLDALAARLEDDTVGAVGALLWYPGKPRRAQHAGMAFTAESRAIHLYRGMTGHDAPGIFASKELQMVTGACIALKTAVAERLGGFDNGYQNGWEDVDLCFRLRLDHGLKVIYEPRAQLVHEEGQTPGRFKADSHNAARFFGKWKDRIVHDAGDIVQRIDGGVRF